MQDHITQTEFEVGDKVRVPYKGEYTKGEVSWEWPDGTYTVTFTEGAHQYDYGYFKPSKIICLT